MRNPFSNSSLRDLALLVSRPSRKIVLDEIARLNKEIARQSAEISRLNKRMDEMVGRVGAVGDGLRKNREQLASYLPPRRFESFDIVHFARLQAAESSAKFFNEHLYFKPTFETAEDLINHSLSLIEGPVVLPLEFGVFSGRTINAIAERLGSEVSVFGFDSFEGLPETWRCNFQQGHFAVDKLPEVRPNVELIRGWFNDTLPDFRDRVMGEGKTNFIHFDCDLYSSTRTIFTVLANHIASDAVFVFDEFFNYPGWQQHEYRAFKEYLAESGFGFEFIGCVPIHQQVAIRLHADAEGSPRI